jgi:hypothetical protein
MKLQRQLEAEGRPPPVSEQDRRLAQEVGDRSCGVVCPT